MQRPQLNLDAPLRLERLDDPMLVDFELPLTGPYFDRYWLPTVGPSVTCLARSILAHAGEDLSLRQIGQSVGLTGEHLPRTIHRAMHFGLIRLGGSRIAALGYVAPLKPGQMARLPEWLTDRSPSR